jgi:chaperonin cofactor prefoldin
LESGAVLLAPEDAVAALAEAQGDLDSRQQLLDELAQKESELETSIERLQQEHRSLQSQIDAVKVSEPTSMCPVL